MESIQNKSYKEKIIILLIFIFGFGFVFGLGFHLSYRILENLFFKFGLPVG